MPTSDAREPDPRRALAALGAVTILGGYLRTIELGGGKLLWNDSVISIEIVDRLGPLEILTQLTAHDPHPPLYYLLLDGWVSVFGLSRASARSLSVVVAVVSIPTLYLLARELTGRRAGLVAAVLLTLSAFHVRMSQTVRMYGLLLLLGLASYVLYVRLLREWTTRRSLGYLVATVAAGLTHAFGATVLLTQVVTVLWLDRGTDGRVSWRRWLPLQTAAALAMLPWYLTLLMNGLGEGGYFIDWLGPPTAVDLVAAVVLYLRPALSGLDVLWLGLLSPVVVLIVLGAAARTDDGPPAGASGAETDDVGTQLALWLVVPIAAALAVTYALRPVFHPRYFAATSVASLVLIARGLQEIDPPDLRRIMLLFVVGIALFGLVQYYDTTTEVANNRFGWGPASDYVDDRAAPGDLVLVDHGDAGPRRTEVPIASDEVIHSSDFFDTHLGRQDVDVQGIEDVSAEALSEAVGCHAGIWVVFHGQMSSDARVEGVLERLDERYVPVSERLFNGRVLVVQYRNAEADGPRC